MSFEQDYLAATNRFGNDLGAICKPLSEFFGFNEFYYVAVHSDGRAVTISTNQVLMEYLVAIKAYNDDPHFTAPENMGHGFIAWSDAHNSKLDKIVASMEEKFNIPQGISYIEKDKDCYRILGFTTAHNDKQLLPEIISNIGYIKKFINYFKTTAREMIQVSESEYSVDLASKKKNFYSQQGIISNNTPHAVAFLTTIGAIKPQLKNITLSRQEQRCISLYLQGNTAQQTAEHLVLSRRTVEGYLNNAKMKLDIYDKRELFALQDALIALGLIKE